jgi:hypothetical protein
MKTPLSGGNDPGNAHPMGQDRDHPIPTFCQRGIFHPAAARGLLWSYFLHCYGLPISNGARPYSWGYLLYLHFGTPSPASWHQASLAVNNPWGSTATVASAEMTLLLAFGSCAQQIELHK